MRWPSSPNYALTIATTLVLPLALGQLAFAVIPTALWTVVLHYKIQLGDAALAEGRLRVGAPL